MDENDIKDKIKSIEPGYRDPLHFSYEDLTIEVGKRKMTLNKRFLDKQNCWDKLENIKSLFMEKFMIFEAMDDSDCPAVLQTHDRRLTELEYQIQEAFGFERNINFHRFWERPKCTCPQLDNQDYWGTKYAIRSGDCPLHGGIVEKGN
jgi:hypothetical protein